MQSVKNFLKDCEAIDYKLTIFAVLTFLSLYLNRLYPSFGNRNFSDVLWTSCFFGLFFGLMFTASRNFRKMSRVRRWAVRIANIAIVFAATFIGGGIGLLVFK